MTLPRRKFLPLAASAAALPLIPRSSWGQSYPARPVRMLIGFPPGGVADIVARLIGQWLSERLGQPFVVENRPGAATNIATEAVVRAPADGYTLLLISGMASATNATLYDNLKFNFIRDIAPVAAIARAPAVMEVNSAVPAATVPEFIKFAKANPAKVNMAISGYGTVPHLAGVIFKIMTGLDLLEVAYRGSAPALTDLIGGRVQVMFDNVPSSIEYIKAETLRPLAVTTTERLDVLPDVPAMSDFLPGYDASGWQALGAPKNTPQEITDKLHAEINAALAEPKFKKRLMELGSMPFSLPPAGLGKYIVDETEKWAKVIKAAGIKAGQH
jgi:tripartite-type tricarboxylate transporter receptor subunit TctC